MKTSSTLTFRMPFKLSRSDLQAFRGDASDLDDLSCPGRFTQWKRICNRTPVYRDTERYLVLKRVNFILNPWTPLKVRVPTIKLDEYGWVVQPYCEKYRLKEAV